MSPTLSAQGFIANTDHDWFRYLRAKGSVDEVNFWQPSGSSQFRAVPPGAPFFFRLKNPFNAIGGFGFFLRFNLAPAWLAWDSFGELNGAASLDEMVARIGRYRRRPSVDDAGRPDGFIVGCIMVGDPVFFADDEWVREPADWHQNVVRGKRIDLLHGEGQRILAQCLERSRAAEPQSETVAVALDAARRGEPILVAPRLGQGTFRIALVSAYGGACAVTGEHSLPVLEAAHIRPFADGGAHALSNGLLLRADVHRLYDKGYVTITGDYDVKVSERLLDDFHNGREYLRFTGAQIALPQAVTERPSRELLDWHAQEVYRG